MTSMVAQSLLEDGEKSMLISADTVAQRRYVRDARKFHPGANLAIGPTVLRGLRDLGFRDTAAALAALVDNAIDAGAHRIDVILDTERGAPLAIAVIDDGYGMVPEMIRAACAVGVSCQLGDGPHLARNGFGLPSAPFAIGSRFDLYSCPRGAALHRVTMDLGEIETDEVPEARRAEFPTFVNAYVAAHLRAWTNGTAVVIGDLDRVAPHHLTSLRAEIRRHLGFVFGRFMPAVTLCIDGEAISPVDPLFLAPGAVGVSSDDQHAVATGDFSIALGEAVVMVRTARLTHDFGSGKSIGGRQSGTSASVAALVDMTSGLVVSRMGRRLAVLTHSPIFNFTRSDRTIRVEIDFPPELDDLFAPALSLQQVHVSGDVWRALRGAGLPQHLEQLRRMGRQERSQRRVSDAPVAAIRLASPKRRNRC